MPFFCIWPATMTLWPASTSACLACRSVSLVADVAAKLRKDIGRFYSRPPTGYSSTIAVLKEQGYTGVIMSLSSK